MISKIYMIFDSKAEAFLPPFFQSNDAMAKRVFSDCVNDPNHHFARHPDDFSLHVTGEFDDATGTINMLDVPLLLGFASVFKDKVS